MCLNISRVERTFAYNWAGDQIVSPLVTAALPVPGSKRTSLAKDDHARTLSDAAKRNERRWKQSAGPDSGQLTFIEDLKQMKEWVAARAQWLDAEIGRRTRR